MPRPLRLIGSEMSPYSVKLRSYPRSKGIPFEWVGRNVLGVPDVRRSALLLVLALLGACSLGPRPVQYESGPATADGLYRVKSNDLGALFLDPGAEFGEYDGVLIDPVSLSYKRDRRRSSGLDTTRRVFELDDDTVARFQRIFQESFVRELGRSRSFAVVSEPGPGVLRVSGHIVDLDVRVPAFKGGEVNFVVDAGEMTLVLDVRDSLSGAPLARVADRRLIRPPGAGNVGAYRSTAVNNWGAVRDIFSDWARILREGLDNLRELAPAHPSGGR
jgi:hypothetical protein